MIENHEKFRMIPENKGDGKEFFIEVNWNPTDESSNGCKLVKFTFPDGSNAMVKREHLHSILFAIGTPEQQKELIPQTLAKVKWYETVLGIKATRDIKKGEMINFPIKITLPVSKEEIINKIIK